MKIAVLGVGRLGLCFALNLEQAGYEVLGVDISEEYVNRLNDKSLISSEPRVSELLRQSKNFKATTHIAEVLTEGYSLLFIMVATPSMADGSYDHSQIERVAGALINSGKREQPTHVVIGCTVMPGYCTKLAEQLAPYNYTVSYNPEFIAQGSIIHDQLHADQVLIGEANREAGDLIESIYRKLCVSKPAICRMDPLSAEITKLATNCFLTMKISFANAIGDLAKTAGANQEKVLAAIGSDSRIGSKYLNYGYGFGGPCFPRDNRALLLAAKGLGMNMPLSEATDKVNKEHLDFQFKEMLQLSDKEPIVFNGVAYKKGTVILEESQQLALAIKLAQAGRPVHIIEQPAVINELKRVYGNLFTYEEV
ncbi:MAG: nucleotide sugar dehydrogenase [Chitinophagales bacterium]